MILTIIKILISLFVGIAAFVTWNLFFSKTMVLPFDSESHNSTAYIAKYEGKHNSLILEGEHGWKEFSYGDWDVYANHNITFWTGFKSMGFPTQGALGFRKIAWDGMNRDSLPTILHSIGVIPIQVEKEKAKNLYLTLETYIQKENTDGVFNSNNNLFFVKYPKAYMAWHTCNNMLIYWLQNMDVQTEGCGWAGNFHVLPTNHLSILNQ